MKAVVIREHGDLDVLRIEERDIPEPGPGQIRLRVEACAMNHLDTWVRRGVPGHTFPLPIIPGCDVSGVVDHLGPGVADASPLKQGDEVLVEPGISCGHCEHCADGDDNLCRRYGIVGETRDGGCAEYLVVPSRNCLPKPASLTFEQAAAIPLVFLTAWHMLVARCGIKPGDDVLIHAAGSGVGSAALQIAGLFGARTIVTAGTDAKLAKARELGADVVINYQSTEWHKEVRAVTDKRGVDIAVDHVGEPTIGKSIASLAKGGRLVTCGATAGFKLETDLRLVFFKSLSILGSTMGSHGELFDILRLVERGRLRPVVHATLPMAEIKEAHRILADREVFGKVVVTP